MGKLLETASLMIAHSALEEYLMQEGDSNGEDDCVVFFLCDEDYLVSACMDVVSA